MQRSAILTATLLSALGLTYLGCTQDFNQFEPGGGPGGGASSSSTMSGPGGMGGMGGVGGAGGMGGTGGMGGAGGMGGMPCANNGQCPADTPCRDWSCVDGMCEADDEPAGTDLSDPTNGDCKTLECDGMGNAVEVVDEDDTPGGDNNPCTDSACVNGMPMHVPTPGDSCQGGSGVCNDAGMCVECVDDNDCDGTTPTCLPDNTCVSCSDGEMNGDETAVDCGGKCGKCPAEACANNAECKSGFCADGVCCNVACTGACRSCNIAGSEGTCTNVPQGMTDDMPACMDKMACDGAGTCKLANGEPCDMPNGSQCASGKCEGPNGNRVCTP